MTLREQVLALRSGDEVRVLWQHSRQGPLVYVGTVKTALPEGVAFVSRAYIPPRVLLERGPQQPQRARIGVQETGLNMRTSNGQVHWTRDGVAYVTVCGLGDLGPDNLVEERRTCPECLEQERGEQMWALRTAYPDAEVTYVKEGNWHLYGTAGESLWITHYTCTLLGWRVDANGCGGQGRTIKGALHDLYKKMAERITSCALTMQHLEQYDPRFVHDEGFGVGEILRMGDEEER